MNTARTLDDLPERFNAAVDLLQPNLDAGRGDKAAVIDGRGTTTYPELADRVDRMVDVYRLLGVEREQRVLLCLLDTIDFPVAFLGALKAGVVPVPLNTLLTADDYAWILQDSGACAVLVSEECAPQWAGIAMSRPDVTFVSSDGGPEGQLGVLVSEASPIRTPADTHRDDVAFWLYTSGSTGRPKGAMHVHGAMRLTANLFGLGVVGYRENDVVFSVAKQFFAYGLGNALTFPYAAGATVILLKDRATPEIVSDLVRRHGVSVLCGVPTFFAGWLNSDTIPTSDALPRLRIATSAGECLPAHLGERFRQRFGVDIVEGLGSTEMLHVYLAQSPDQVRYGCTGRPVPGYEIRLVDEAGGIAEPGAFGELQVRGPTAAVGYWRNRSKSQATFVGEWTRTGDVYTRDAEGWHTYAGRRDDMLKVSGIYVSPSEVEEVLSAHEAVLEAAVVAAPDDAGLIKLRAHVVLKSGGDGQGTETVLRDYLKSRLAPYKCPRWIVFADVLPKTATGKIQRFRLRD
jgi:benzoate-CoA ligase